MIDARQNVLWGNLLAGGWGVEWYFGYKHAHSDLTCQDYRSRDKMWDQCRHALEFLRTHKPPVEDMSNADNHLTGADGYCLAKPGDTYLLLVKDASQPASLDLGGSRKTFEVRWFESAHRRRPACRLPRHHLRPRHQGPRHPARREGPGLGRPRHGPLTRSLGNKPEVLGIHAGPGIPSVSV